MDNGHEERLAERFSGVGLRESSEVKNDSLFQVIKAVEAAEATIKQQVEENNLLKSELQRRYLELAKYKSGETTPQASHSAGSSPLHQSVDRRKGVVSAPGAGSSVVIAAEDENSPEEAMFPAMFVFGDSLVDNGNNNRLNSLARSNYLPYGIDFDGGQPTGRFSNGKTIVDFIGELLGLPDIPAFMETMDGGVDVLRGVNYASAAGGILEETGRHLGERFSMRRQVENFDKTLMEISRGIGSSVTEYMAKSLVVVSLGNNDYINNYLKPSLFLTSSIYNPTSFADLLVSNFTSNLLELYDKGFRKFVLAGVGPLGCIPDQLAARAVPPGECVESVNEMAELFNNRLKSLVDRLNTDNKTGRDAIFVYGNTYGAAVDILTNPIDYGFEVTDRGCCGVGRNGGEITCLPLAVPCAFRDRHVFWDAFHPTQAFNLIIALRAFNGSKSDCYPINLLQMSRL
ncbi:hypothetical protein F2Q68_00023078 [Brassica cretica]|uniref:Uncharacterized protein n=1 Tax=Brassica cretica TaxID=69181 RepID=A0A8S9G4G9_BRACR|nr:hypothetical protein F2Q68_00023078 [Brassica cretica]